LNIDDLGGYPEDDDTPFARKLTILLNAINDWDEEQHTVEEFLEAVRKFLGGSLNVNRQQMHTLLAAKDFRRESWKMESIAGLATLLDETESLQESLDRLLNEIKAWRIN
jgi:hypothetical protein